MKREVAIAAVLALLLGSIGACLPQRDVTGMTQGKYALELLQNAGQGARIGTVDEAVNELTKLGVMPDGGWKADEMVTADVLASILGAALTESQTSADLDAKVLDLVEQKVAAKAAEAPPRSEPMRSAEPTR